MIIEEKKEKNMSTKVATYHPKNLFDKINPNFSNFWRGNKFYSPKNSLPYDSNHLCK